MQNGMATLENSRMVPGVGKHAPALLPNNTALRCWPKITETHIYLDGDVHKSTSHSCLQLDTAARSIS